MADSKKPHFPAPPICNIFSSNFHGLVLGLVELVDAKGIGVAQLIWSSLLHLKENKQVVHMKYNFFLNYGWFLQNLGEEAVRTNM